MKKPIATQVIITSFSSPFCPDMDALICCESNMRGGWGPVVVRGPWGQKQQGSLDVVRREVRCCSSF